MPFDFIMDSMPKIFQWIFQPVQPSLGAGWMNSLFGETLAIYLETMPEILRWTIPLTLLFVGAGWISSLILALRHKWMVLLTLFPLTYPIALIGLAIKQWKASMLPLSLHLAAVISWLGGAYAADRAEWSKLTELERQLQEGGESLHMSKGAYKIDDPDNNVWDHSFLRPLKMAADSDASGEAARDALDTTYAGLDIPRKKNTVRYQEIEPDHVPQWEPLKRLHRLAVDFEAPKKETETAWKSPTTVEQTTAALIPFFAAREADMHQLMEAVSRPQDIYPLALEQGFATLLPHLTYLRQFTRLAVVGSIWHAYQGHGPASFNAAQLALRLCETGDSDLLISRLVQFAQMGIALETLVAAQDQHLWTEDQWLEIRKHLETINLISRMPDAIRAERSFGFASVEPIIKAPFKAAMQHLNNLGGPLPDGSQVANEQAIVDRWRSQTAGAILIKQWRLCLEAYQMMINDLEAASKASETEPWQAIIVSWEEKNIKAYGIFAAMMLPALDKAHGRALVSQTWIELARVSIDLERYYIRHAHYPEKLEDLVPSITREVPIDPMTRSPLPYQRLGKHGFEIYSAGLNGKDEGGRSTQKQRHKPGGDAAPDTDDILWRVLGDAADIPSFEENEPKGMDPDA